MQESLAIIVDWFVRHQIDIYLSLAIILFYTMFRRIVIPLIEKYTERDHLKNETLKNAILSVNLFSGLLTLIILLFIWGFNFRELVALSTGLIALTGVALFASWSLLSNITAFFLLLAHQSYRRGNFVRIIEMDNYIEGYIADISLFNTKLISENREVIIYPNNLLIGRPVVINPKSRFSVVGKTTEFVNVSQEFMD